MKIFAVSMIVKEQPYESAYRVWELMQRAHIDEERRRERESVLLL